MANLSNKTEIPILDIKGPVNWPYMQPPIFESFWFEKFNVVQYMSWMEKNHTYSFYICAVYLISIYIGKKFMTNKKPFDLHGPYALWNLGFTVFSVCGFVRCIPELLFVLSGPNGFHRSVCIRDSHNEPGAFWAWALTLSKVAELGDTAFMVLRKKPVNAAHVVHHGLALVLTWFLYPIYEPMLRYLGDYNFFLHSILYGYLFLKTIGIEMPKYFPQTVLFLELLQLILGFSLNVYAVWIKADGQLCEHRADVILIETLFYLIYGTVLVKYFINYKNRIGTKFEKKM